MDSFSAKLKLSDEMVLMVVRRHLELSTKRAKMCYFRYQHQKNKCALAFILFFKQKFCQTMQNGCYTILQKQLKSWMHITQAGKFKRFDK